MRSGACTVAKFGSGAQRVKYAFEAGKRSAHAAPIAPPHIVILAQHGASIPSSSSALAHRSEPALPALKRPTASRHPAAALRKSALIELENLPAPTRRRAALGAKPAQVNALVRTVPVELAAIQDPATPLRSPRRHLPAASHSCPAAAAPPPAGSPPHPRPQCTHPSAAPRSEAYPARRSRIILATCLRPSRPEFCATRSYGSAPPADRYGIHPEPRAHIPQPQSVCARSLVRKVAHDLCVQLLVAAEEHRLLIFNEALQSGPGTTLRQQESAAARNLESSCACTRPWFARVRKLRLIFDFQIASRYLSAIQQVARRRSSSSWLRVQRLHPSRAAAPKS